MKANLTDVTVVLDRSGSMVTIQDDTIGGYNSFIETLKREPGQCVVSLYQFDNDLQADYIARRVNRVPPLNHSTFMPRASTALLRSVCEVIDATGARLRAVPEGERPTNVIFAIVTDGMENASGPLYSYKLMADKIEHQRTHYAWRFMFLGANQDAIATAARMGIDRGSALTYAANSAGTASAFYSAGKYASNVARGMSAVSFDAEDLELQAKAGAQSPSTGA